MVLTVALLVATVPALADGFDRGNRKGNQVILRALAEDAGLIAEQHGLDIVADFDGPEGYTAVVEGPDSLTEAQIRDLLYGDPRVQSLDSVQLTALPDTADAVLASEEASIDLAKAGDFTTPCLAQGFSGPVWSGYGDQEAARKIRLHEAHLVTNCGAGAIVAIIDTGVDPDHPILAGAFVDGYDFLAERAGVPSEWTDVSGTMTAIVEGQTLDGKPIFNGTMTAIVEDAGTTVLQGNGELLLLSSFGPVLAESGISVLASDTTPRAFGHGTMTAGLVRLTAPGARIMPLRAFGGDGTANLFDVVRAVYYAVDHGANVINMSFSLDEHSVELQRAIQYARKRGVVCTAAAGNTRELATVYPAAYGDTVGIAAVTLEDTLSEFSNYGSGLVELGAPGHGVISAYPGGFYGAGWGTSFSTPLVSGTLALLAASHPGSDNAAAQARINALRDGSEPLVGLESTIGSGRLDVLGTVLAAE